MNTTQGDPAQAPNVDAQAYQRERVFEQLQNLFEGKVEADVIRHVLSESQWKVGDALKMLQNLVTSFVGREAVPEPMKSQAAVEHGQYLQSVMQSNTRHHHLSLTLTSKIPLASDETGTLPMLSPKTPFFGELEYPPFTASVVQDSNMVQAMEALQMYAHQPVAQMPPTPDVYFLQHGQMAGGGNTAQAPHPLTMPPQNMMPISSPDSYISAEPTYTSQMQRAHLQSPDGTIIPEAQFSGSYPVDTNASFYPSADPFRATQNLYDAQHSEGNVSAGWFAPSSESSEAHYAVVAEAEQMKAVDVGHNVSTEVTDVNKANRPSKKVFRTKAYSLNPEEREALENLIEDVIIGGVDNEVMTSDESDSDFDNESDVKEQSEGKEGNGSKDTTGSDGLPKVYPAQLKVAVKHMKNLPPRFLKKIHAAPKTGGGDVAEFDTKRQEEREELRMVAEREKSSKMEGQKRDIKKKIRNMIDGLDSYVEEHIVLVDEDCCKTNDSVDMVTSKPPEEVPVSAPPPVTDTENAGGRKVPTGASSPMLGMSAQRIVLKPNVINCSDLERELLGESQAEKKSTFSVDAPEFVPRAFTPISQPPLTCVSLAQGVCPPVTTSPYRGSVPGHNSPQPFSSQLHQTRTPLEAPIPHSSPTAAYMIPKVTYPMSTPATIVGMRFHQYPTPTYNVAAMPQFNPVLQPPFVPPGFGIQDLGANRAGQGMYPLYVSPQCKPLNPYINHLSPHSSPKAVRRVIDPSVMHMGMQPILIPRPMPHLSPNSNARPGEPSYSPLYTANVYRHLSPHSSPKLQRRGATDGDGAAVAGLKHKIHGLLASGKKVMIILRGLPGSGKTTLARELQGSGVVLSTDDFFMNNGKYQMDYSKLSEAHEWNRQKAVEAVEAAVNPVIIDNTNVHSWEMKPYVALALKYSYHVEFVEPPTQWRHKPTDLAEKNIHHVTVESLRRMRDCYEQTVTVESIMRHVATPQPAKSVGKDEPDLPLSEDATDTAQGKKPVRRRKRKRRKRKRKPAEEDKANEGESSDEDSAGEGEEVVDAEEGSASEASHKCNSAEGKDQQGNLQCPPCRRQGGHITSLAALANAQLELQLHTQTKHNLLAQHQDIPQHIGVSDALLPLIGQSGDAHVTHAYSLNEDTDILLKACSEAVMRKVAPMELDKNGNNAQDCGEFVQKTKETRNESDDRTKAQEEDEIGKLVEALMDDNVMKSEHPMILDGDSRKKVEALKDESIMLSEQLMVLGSDSGKTVMLSLESLPGVSIGSIQAQRSGGRQPSSDDCCKMPERQTEMLLMDTNVQDSDIVSGACGTVADLDDDGELAEITSSSSLSSLSQEAMGPACPRPYNRPDAVSPDCSGSDEDKGCSESTSERLQDSCSSPKTDDEKWTEKCEKSEIRHLEAAVADSVRRPKQRRRLNSEEKINILMAVDQLDLRDMTSWKSLTEVVSAPVTPVAKGNPGFHRFSSCDPTSSELPKFASLPPDGMGLLEEESVLSVSDVRVKDVETYTCPEDYALLQKITHSTPVSCNLVHGQRVLCCSARVISENLPSHTPPVRHHTHTATLDKGCTTDDLLVAPSVDGVKYLHCCFPEVSLDDLSYMLSTCGGDIEWAANVLLDTGHEYKVDNEGDVNTTALNLEESTDVAKESEMSVDGEKCRQQLQSKNIDGLPLPDELELPSLFCLCHACLTPTILGSLQETISDSDMARLLAIRDFNESHSKITNLANSDDRLVTESISAHDVQNQCVRSPQDGNTDVNRHVDGSLVLPLTDTLAAQLIHLFGPVDVNMSNGLTEDALLVHLDTETARRLHELWAYSAAHRKTAVLQDTLLTDEELARRLQEEEDRAPPHSHPVSPQLRPRCVSVQDLEQVVSERVDERREREREGGEAGKRPDSPPASLKEIMEEEEVLQLSRKEYEALQSAASDEQAISTKLKRQKLLEMFPYVDPTVLVDVFKSSQYHLETTCTVIRELFSPPGCPPVDPSSVTLGSTLTEEQLLTWPDELDGQTASKGGQGKYCDDDFRSDAAMHYRLRLECFEKARDAYRRQMMSVAAFYSQQGHAHTQKMKAANEAAAQKILQHRNPCLSQARSVDLHGLHVAEALHTLEQLLTNRERELYYQPDKRRRHLLVMTGKGNHSHGGVARIRLAVIDYLKKNNYRYSEAQPGLIKILLKYRGVE